MSTHVWTAMTCIGVMAHLLPTSGILGSILGNIRQHSEDLTHSLAFMEVERIILPIKQEVAMTSEETNNPCVEMGAQRFV